MFYIIPKGYRSAPGAYGPFGAKSEVKAFRRSLGMKRRDYVTVSAVPEGTLVVPGDFVAKPLGQQVLSEAAVGLHVIVHPACAYCGLSEADGDFTILDDGGTPLCEFCIKDEVLGACGHRRTCDCQAGIC